jgi:hypothetical protein
VNVDWDLLADHLGGALAGTPEGERVERLVATDPGWARAAGELSTAMDAVTTDLRTLPAPTIPDDIAARLDAALEAPDVVLAVSPTPSHPAGAGRSVDESRRPPSHPGTRRRRRVTRWSAGLAVAAGVATFAAIGLGSWLGAWEGDGPLTDVVSGDGDEDSGAAAPEPEQPPSALDGTPPVEGFAPSFPTTLMVATGTDYQEDMLATAEPERPVPVLGGQDEPSPPPQAPDSRIDTDDAADSVPPSLVRLWVDPAARAACLELIMASLRPPPVTINTVDFAMYQGQPALVIWATDGNAGRWAWVSGPDCGAVAGDPDVQFQTQLS